VPPEVIGVSAMLMIRDAQMQAFREQTVLAFVRQIISGLRSAHPEAVLAPGEEEVRRFVEQQVARAPRLGIELTCDVERFVALMFGITRTWNEPKDAPWVDAILNDADLGPVAKLDRLECDALLAGLLPGG